MASVIRIFIILLLIGSPGAMAQNNISEQPKLVQSFVSVCRDLNKPELSLECCQCLGKNYVTVAMTEKDLKKSIKILLWIKSLYRGTLTQSEYRKDEFALNELIDAIHKGCLTSPSYDHYSSR